MTGKLFTLLELLDRLLEDGDFYTSAIELRRIDGDDFERDLRSALDAVREEA